MGSAAYWWGRLAAAVVVRLPLYLSSPAFLMEILLYVDDVLFLAACKTGMVWIGSVLLFLVALGVPLRWDKCRGGVQVEWIGYWADFIGISEKRAAWLADWMTEQVACAGRLQCCAGRNVLAKHGVL